MAQIHVVLVRSKYASNIGAVARAMANMGAQRLILVDPKTPVNSKARQGAAGAQEQLRSHTTRYQSWDDFYAHEGAGIRIAFSRRSGKRRPLIPLRPLLQKITTDQPAEIKDTPIYLIFGPEDHGLDAEDMAFVNYCSSLPTYGMFKSLNLSQAALLALFIAAEELKGDSDDMAIWQEDQVGAEDAAKKLEFPDQSIRQWLEAMGFDIQARRASAYTTLRRLLLQNLPTDNELMVLQAILQQNIRKLNEAAQAHRDIASDTLAEKN